MSACKFCGLDVTFHGYGRAPTDPCGRDHRETCPGIYRQSRQAVRDSDHEQAVQRFLFEAYQLPKPADKRISRRGPRRTCGSLVTHVYCDDRIPPWDESLGAFRDFTDAEKLAGIVCEVVVP